MLVYRVEFPANHAGPYRGNTIDPFDWWTDSTVSNGKIQSKHPLPSEDGFLLDFFVKPQHLFGFESIESLSNWFSDSELERLFSIGYHIVIYDAEPESVRFLNSQVIFNKEKAKFVEVWL